MVEPSAQQEVTIQSKCSTCDTYFNYISILDVVSSNASVIYRTTASQMNEKVECNPTGGAPTFGRNGKYSLVSN